MSETRWTRPAGPHRHTRRAVREWPLLVTLISAVLLLAACGDTPAPDLTVTPVPYNPTQGALLLLTPTTLPLAPIEEGPAVGESGVGAPGVSNPTQAGLAAEGQPAQDLPPVTPQPTQARFPMAIGAADGLLLQGDYYSAARRPAPGALLLHQGERDRSTWTALAERLQSAGYAVLTLDLRGYGATGGTPDWALAPRDAAAALEQLSELPGVDANRLIVVGAGIGANLGLNACADRAGCGAAVLLSPGLDYLGITTGSAIVRMGARPVLIITSENDGNNPADSVALNSMAQGPHRLDIYPGAGHGTDILAAEPGFVNVIAEWLVEVVPPPAPGNGAP